jgi:hypothetical protein
MGLAENDDMIQALATDRPDQALGKSILPDLDDARRKCRHGLTIRNSTNLV